MADALAQTDLLNTPPGQLLTGPYPQFFNADDQELPFDSEEAKSARAEAGLVDPLVDLSADDLAALSTQTKGEFNLGQLYKEREEHLKNPDLRQKLADAFVKYSEATPLIPIPKTWEEAGKAVGGLWDMAKGYAKTLAVGLPAAVVANTPGMPKDWRDTAEILEAEIISGNRAALQGLANTATHAGEKFARATGLAPKLSELDAQGRMLFFERAMAEQQQVQDISEGRDKGFLAPDPQEMERLRQAGYEMNPEEVGQYAAGSPLALKIFGSAFGAAGKGISKITPAVVARGAAALPAVAERAGGKVIELGAQAAEAGSRGAAAIAPAVGAVSSATGIGGSTAGVGTIGAGWLGWKAGQSAAKTLRTKVIPVTQKVQQLGREVAGKVPVTTATAQLTKDLLGAAPEVAGELGKGLAFDAALAMGAETSEEQMPLGPGAFFAIPAAAVRGSLRVVSGQLIAPRAWDPGSNRHIQSNGFFPSLDKVHVSETLKLTPGEQARVNAMRAFVRMFDPNAEVFFSGADKAAYLEALRQAGASENILRGAANSEGMFTASLADAQGNKRRLITFSDIEAAPHEVKHAMDDVMGHAAARARWAKMREYYTPQEWENFAKNYASALGWDGKSDVRDYLARASGFANAEAAEILARQKMGDQQGPPSPEMMQDALTEVSQNGAESVLGTERFRQIGDEYIGAEVSAENWKALFNHTGPNPKVSTVSLENTARMFGAVLSALGIDPLSGRFADYGLPLRSGAVKQVGGEAAAQTGVRALRPVIAPRVASQAPAKTQIEKDRESDQRIATSAPDTILEGAEQSVRDMAGALAEAAATGQGVRIIYRSAPAGAEGGAGPAAAAALGGITKAVTRPVRRRIIEAARNLPEEAREMISKVFVPFKLRSSRKGLQAGGWAPEVFAANAQKLAEFLTSQPGFHPELFGPDGPYAVDTAGKTFTVDGWRNLLDDAATFSKNQGAGMTGAGEPLVVPKTPGYYEPPVQPGAATEALPQERADVINRLFGLKRQSTGIVASETKIPLNLVGQRVSEATKPGRVTEVGGPEFGTAGAKSQARAEKLGIVGEKVRETNPFAAELEAQPKAPSFIEAFQWLNLEHMKSVEIAAEQPQIRGNTLTLTAGFKPMVNESTQFKPRTKPEPKKKVTAYKLFRVTKDQPGKLFPLYVDAKNPVEIGKWLDAEDTQAVVTAEGKKRVRVSRIGATVTLPDGTKVGTLAYRPGWHAGDMPLATHIGKKDPKTGEIVARQQNDKWVEVWAEVEMGADKDYQQAADATGGKGLPRLPVDGSYRYKTNPNMTGEWIIGGTMKVNRVLSEAQVAKILKAQGVEPMPWDNGPLNLAKWGFGEQRVQYKPSNHPDAIESAATRDDKTGKVYTGVMHFESNLKYLEDHPELRNGREMDDPATPLQAWNKLPDTTDGFVTKTGKFLTREEAEKHALKINQLKEPQVGMGGLESDYLRQNAQFASKRDKQKKVKTFDRGYSTVGRHPEDAWFGPGADYWVDPQGILFPLSTGETHNEWASKNSKKIFGEEVSVDDAHDMLLSEGWARVASDYDSVYMTRETDSGSDIPLDMGHEGAAFAIAEKTGKPVRDSNGNVLAKPFGKDVEGEAQFKPEMADDDWLNSIDTSKYEVKAKPVANTPEMLIEAKRKSAQIKKAALPNSAAGEEINVVHLSDQPGLKMVDPAKLGQGKATPRDLRGLNKSYWFVEKSPLGQDAAIFGQEGKHAYGTTLRGERIYDLRGDKEDALGYFSEPNRETADRALMDKGYAGLITDTPDGRQVVMLFKGAKVAPIGKTKGGETAPKGLRSEMVQFAAADDPNPRKIKAAIVWDPNTGKHWEGAMHFLALQRATAEGVKPQELGQLTQGFIDVAGNKLTREEAFVRAQELEQLKAAWEGKEVGQGSKEEKRLISEETQFKPRDLVTPEMEKKLSKSAVRFSDGTLKPVFHGTARPGGVQMDRFNTEGFRAHFGSPGQAASRVVGPPSQRTYDATKKGAQSRVAPAFLDIREPLFLDGDPANWRDPVAVSDVISERIQLPKNLSRRAVEDRVDKLTREIMDSGGEEAESFQAAQDTVIEEIKQHLIAKGYDGIVHVNRFESEKPLMVPTEGRGDMAYIDEGSPLRYSGQPDYKSRESYIPFRRDQIINALTGEKFSETSAQFKAAKLEEFSDETKLADALKSRDWAILTWNQEALGPATAEANLKANEALAKRLTDAGYDFQEIKGSYEGVDQGKNFLVTGIKPEDALTLGQEGKQESVIVPDGLLYADGSLYKTNPENTIVGEDAKKQAGWSQVSGGPAFSLGLDFSEKVKYTPAVEAGEATLFEGNQPAPKRVLSSSELASMGVKELRDYYPEAVIPNRTRNKKGEPKDPELASDHKNSPLYKSAKNEAEAVELFADELVKEHEKWKDNPSYQSGLKWYSEFTPMLKEHFGDDAQIFAELLSATSPNNSPNVNFQFALDAILQHRKGKYNAMLEKFSEGLKKIEDGTWEDYLAKAKEAGRTLPAKPTKATFLEQWINDHDLIPRKSNGTRFGMHSIPVLKVLARKWLSLNSGPKTLNFIKNLVGTGDEATFDVWADRTLRRVGYQEKGRWRITPLNSTGIPDADFYFGQKVFRRAADRLGIKPSALQGGLWFSEKQLWADRGWGRLDLGDYRTEMRNIEKTRAKLEAQGKTEQEELPIVTPRPTPTP